MHRGSNPRSSVHRMYRSRAQGGTGLLIVRGCVKLERSKLSGMLQTATREWKAAWKEKLIHGQFLRETEEMQDQRRWQRLKVGDLKNTCPRTSTQNKCSKKWHCLPGRVHSMETLQGESWKCLAFCQFLFCSSWKPIKEETQQKCTGSYARTFKLNVKTMVLAWIRIIARERET